MRGTKWMHYADSDNKSFFYDKTTIKKHTHSIVRVWQRIEVKDVSAHIDKRKEDLMSAKGYDKFSHSITLSEYDCSNNAVALVSAAEYDINGNVLNSYDIEKRKFSTIIPDSIASALIEVVCKGYKHQPRLRQEQKNQEKKRESVMEKNI